ncbi:MAG: DUF5916 domain-containing protein [Candidatus Latescibacterota bacterium]
MDPCRRLPCLAVAGLLLAGAAAADPQAGPVDSVDARMAAWLTHPQRVARAVRAAVPPVIDGRLDEEAWGAAPAQSDFLQRDPDQGQPATQRTAFRLLYDDEALYIGAMCYDTAPDSIVARLGRRDAGAERDFFQVNLDPHHDHQTGVYFRVDPSGWREDGILFNDGWDDNTWDGVWDTQVARVEGGWSAELEIPYHNLRFGHTQSYTWGINVSRRISRRQEFDQWVLIPRGVNGWTSHYGHLEGIEGIEPQRILEVFPVALGRLTRSPGGDGRADASDLFGALGLDLRYALSSSISLNATVNPDFGQVEADPAVLNLSAFETFYSERRPFFLEGISLFEPSGPHIAGIGGPARLFHSRRIGGQPSRFALPDSSAQVSRPDNTTILGALKLSGKTRQRTAFGVLDAVTGSEYAQVDLWRTSPATGQADTTRRRLRVESRTNWFVGRLQQDLLTNSAVGAQLTAVNGDDFEPAYVGAADSHLKWGGNAWQLYSRLATSRAGQASDRRTGWEGVAYLSKFSGAFGGQLYLDARSPHFDVNDLGYMDRNDRIQAGLHLYHEQLHPYWFARRSGFNANVWQHWNFAHDRLSRGVNLNMWHELHSYWGFWTGVDRVFDSWDDLGTRGGPVMRSPGFYNWAVDVWSDDRGPVSGSLDGHVRWGQGGDDLRAGMGVEIELRPVSQVELEIEPSYAYARRFAQWIDNVDDDGDEEADHFVFGELDSRVFEVGVRGTWALTPVLSVQLYLQPFVTTGDYGAVKELVRPRSYQFAPYSGLEDDPDFRRRALRANVVLRWEYAPGSTLFAVWQQVRDRDFDQARNPRFAPLSDAFGAFGDSGDNVLLVKANRWLGL